MSTENAGQARPQITISGIIERLHNGKTRREIRDEFGLTGKQAAIVFSHPQLKGRKTIVKSELPFDLLDDVTGTSLAQGPRAVAASAEPTQGVQTAAPVTAQEEAPATSSGRRNRAAASAEPAAEEPEHHEATEEEQGEENLWN
jgi:hypothetical protein